MKITLRYIGRVHPIRERDVRQFWDSIEREIARGKGDGDIIHIPDFGKAQLIIS